MQEASVQQQGISDQLVEIRENINSHTGSITRDAWKKYTTSISDIFAEFQIADNQINELYGATHSTHPYFTDKFSKQVSDMVSQMTNSLSLIDNKVSEINEQPTFDNDESMAIPEETNSDQEKRLILQATKLKTLSSFINKINIEDRSKLKAYYQLKLESLSASWASINQLHEEILNSANTRRSEEYIHNGIFDNAEEKYTNTAVFLRQMVDSNIQLQGPQAAAADHIKLPRLNIPEFSGNINDWKPFQDIFIQLIHENQSLSNLQKFQYLKTRMLGEAAKLLQHLELSAHNYETAWKTLVTRYDNKRRLVFLKLQTLTSQPALSVATSQGLRNLHDTTQECLHALTNMDVDTSSWGPLVEFLMLQKLDKESIQLYEHGIQEPTKVQELSSFLKFLDARFKTFESIDCQEKNNKNTNINRSSNMDAFKSNFRYQRNPSFNKTCALCKENHSIYQCEKFKKLTVKERCDFVSRNQICSNCLGKHINKTCMSDFKCTTCKGRHHSLLHFNHSAKPANIGTYPKKPEYKKEVHQSKATYSATKNGSDDTSTDTKSEKSPQIQSHVLNSAIKRTLLATALIRVIKSDGSQEFLRGLVDQGSEATFITEDAAQRLNLQRTKTSMNVSGIADTSAGFVKSSVNLNVTSRFQTPFSTTIDALILPKLTKFLPAEKIPIKDWKHVQHLLLADPNYDVPSKIDLIIGVDLFEKILLQGLIRGEPGAPMAQQTEFGWILSGVATSNIAPRMTITSMLCHTEDEDTLRKFWEIEDIQQKSILTQEEQYCEDHFDKTHQRNDDGRYIVKLPFKDNNLELGSSLGAAICRLKAMERKFQKDPQYKSLYVDFMDTYESMDHMEKIPKEEIYGEGNILSYLPHHGVLKESSTSTKLRVVFDASCKTSTGVSLNNKLSVGPTIQNDIFTIVTRFRSHSVVITADIEKMYRQILIDATDADYQRIVWRRDETLPYEHFRLKTVTYGTSCAPFLATRTLKQLAEDIKNIDPQISDIIKRDFYVDDLMTGCQTIEEGKQIQMNLSEIMSRSGFELRKWASNCPEVLQNLPEDYCVQSPLQITSDTNPTIKTLGLAWEPNKDYFSFKVSLLDEDKITKRKLLSEASKIFDPFGWLSPNTIQIKILFQQLWLTNLDWDDILPPTISEKWLQIRDNLHLLEKVVVPRWLINHNNKIQLHGFCDASEAAYSAVVYCRSENSIGTINVTLVAAKTKVAPIKQISIPRLELSGAVLLTRLMKKIAEALNHLDIEFFAWTDSTIVLAWISSVPRKWKTFIANRTSEIITEFPSNIWRHVPTKTNPADCASRGISSEQLVEHTLWWNGPDWLQQSSSHWPTLKKELSTSLEMKGITATTTLVSSNEILDKFSSFTKASRVVAYCIRFISNSRIPAQRRSLKQLTVAEIIKGTDTLIQMTQKETFSGDLKYLQNGKSLPSSSKILSLNPFLDNKGIIRLGGRLQNSNLNYNQKNPIILPHKSALTTMIINKGHMETLHGGNKLTLAVIRQTYWIINGIQAVKAILHKCVKCHRYKAKGLNQLMGNLPAVRVNPSRAFSNTGVDYAGPINVRVSKGRGNKSYKGYLAIFVCLATKAIHIEVVSDSSAEGFIAAFKRFTSRRGLCTNMYSDNGTNFVGANTKMIKLHDKVHKALDPEIADFMTTKGITWHFIPPASPNFGGIWEAGVKSTKYHLKRVIGDTTLTFEELSTVICQIEACLNSRPLCPLNNDPEDLSILTPGHFLVGSSLMLPPEPSLLDQTCVSNRWRQLTKMTQDLWKQWSNEYLARLQQRPKWKQVKDNVKLNDIVLVRDEQLPPSKWLLGRIIEIHPGKDGLIRVVTLKLGKTTMKRPISKICPLPISTTSDNDHKNEKEELVPAEEVK